MGSYIPVTQAEHTAMLETVGVTSVEELFCQIPEAVRVRSLNIPAGKAELEVRAALEEIAEKNTVFRGIFRGAGAYNHYIPAIVKSVTSKEEFVTAYTPYQAEISQGVLQSIFEYQTMICQLTGMDASNASVYDGPTASAEAVSMCRERRRNKALISATAHPDVIETVRTYCTAAGTQLEIVPSKGGKTDPAALKALLDDTAACFLLQQPNYYGLLEDAAELGETAHNAGAKYILNVNPISLGLYKSPAEYGADIAVGEGQPLGMPLSFGGPYLGFMACKEVLVRRLPGRIVGETADKDGNRAFVLTLQAREQHIRREKASSNICSNQALCAMTAAVYLAAMGESGLRQAASQCHSKACYAAGEICSIPGFSPVYNGAFFHEFVTTSPMNPEKLLEGLERKGILGGLPVEDGILWCVTEVNTKAQIDALVHALKEVCTHEAVV